MAKILILGEIVGRAGIGALKNGLREIKDRYGVDYTIANAEGATNGFGLGKAHSIQLGKMGIDLLTGGEKLFYKPDLVEFISKAGFIIRPLNYPPQTPGRSSKNITINNRRYLIISLQGNSLLNRQSLQNAFLSIDGYIKKATAEENKPSVIVVFHAATTAEKATMFHFLDGRVSAVIGTHTKVMTADSCISEHGTAFISDNGRVGSFMSVGGLSPEVEIRKLLTQIPERSKEAWDDARIQGVIVDIDDGSGLAKDIIRIDEKVNVAKPEAKSNEAEC